MCVVNNSHGFKSHFIRSTLPHYHCKICMHVNVWYLGLFFLKPHDFYYTYFTQPDIRARILIDLKTEHKGNSSRFPQVLNFTQLCTEIIILMNDVRHEHLKRPSQRLATLDDWPFFDYANYNDSPLSLFCSPLFLHLRRLDL